MTTVSINDAAETLPQLLREAERGPVLIRDGERDVAVLVTPDAWSERTERFARFERSREKVIAELTEKLGAANVRYVDFVNDILNDLMIGTAKSSFQIQVS
jgi:antitoxin (DNA-binding transcriptional repressor) of toxin-antitoxin stability system